MRRTLGIVAGVLVLAVGAAACGDDDSSDADGDDSQATTTTADATTTTAAAGPATLAVASTDLGDVLVDADGLTIYLFTNDEGTTTAASEDLQQAWPPLTVDSEDAIVAGDGIDDALLGTAAQADGSIWVTYNGHLLYRYAGDNAPGDTAGQGIGGVWFAVSPTGEQVP